MKMDEGDARLLEPVVVQQRGIIVFYDDVTVGEFTADFLV
jgi:hypothetical protein